MNISTTPSAQKKARPADGKLGFGQVFTDHMFLMNYDPKQGWRDARIVPYGPLALDPATMVFHYGQAIFEGLKAYRTPANAVQLFRPMANLERFNRSADLLCIKRFDAEFALSAIKKLVDLERDWVPSAPGTSLYIRPFIIATDAFLGVRASATYLFAVILSPVGAYYPEGFAPVKIWVSKSHVRAVKGGVGEAKTAGNYAASLLAGEKAHDQGYTQVLWLDGVERKFVEEVGSMNIFFIINGELTTSAL
ncbi:MAG: branched-chain amino acid aminotransferase, partial [Proteobacteria bacterium]|nr:branched-chain amino acid aminotransferase [Pseudomonadota bacterium]